MYRQVEYACAAAKVSQCPQNSVAEIAFVGRSNAGKSSAINAICHRKSLARVSKKPGRTQLLHYFTLPKDRYLVDLPGYGYASVPQSTRLQWQELIQQYLSSRQPLRGLVLLMDSRHPLTDSDWQLVNWVHSTELNLYCALTKADKLSRSAAALVLRSVEKELSQAQINAQVGLFSIKQAACIAQVHTWLNKQLNSAGSSL